jgi:hypothetical protein
MKILFLFLLVLPKATNAVIKEFPKAGSTYATAFRKLPENLGRNQ